MLMMPARTFGFKVIILDPDKGCPASCMADEHLVRAFDDEEAIRLLSKQSDVVTYEFEHIDSKTLEKLETQGALVFPTAKSLIIIQNKLTQKETLKKAGIKVPQFRSIGPDFSLSEAGQEFGYPFLLKSCTDGYDGKGNAVISSEKDLENAREKLASQLRSGVHLTLMAEAFVPFVCEISVLACRSVKGEIVVYPVAHNIHKDNILFETRVPAVLPVTNPQKTEALALQTAKEVMQVFEGVGVFVIEMFVTKEGDILVNEIAPRVHNSGHYTIEACVCSQYEAHIRAIAGLPLGDPTLLRPAALRNLLGEAGHIGKAKVIGLEEAMALPGVHVHIYGKEETKPGRKMGHITATADTLEKALDLVNLAHEKVKIISAE